RTPEQAFRDVDRKALTYHVAAAQSAMFNAMLDQRLENDELTKLKPGDLAFKHDNGATFLVDPLTADSEDTHRRLGAFEISPTGPMWGATMQRADDEVDVDETEALAEFGITIEDLEACARRQKDLVRGARRPYRVPVTNHDVEAGVDEHGPFIRCVFDLPKGSFATAVLREIMKPPEGRVFLDQREHAEAPAPDDEHADDERAN
ncbi:MAG: tRNA pseudouridine(13) synthase TruD, partial [Planctomycetota bacterium]